MKTVKTTLKEAVEMFDILLANGQTELNQKVITGIKIIFQDLISLKKWGVKQQKEIQEAIQMFDILKIQNEDELLHNILESSTLILGGVSIHIECQKTKK